MRFKQAPVFEKSVILGVIQGKMVNDLSPLEQDNTTSIEQMSADSNTEWKVGDNIAVSETVTLQKILALRSGKATINQIWGKPSPGFSLRKSITC